MHLKFTFFLGSFWSVLYCCPNAWLPRSFQGHTLEQLNLMIHLQVIIHIYLKNIILQSLRSMIFAVFKMPKETETHRKSTKYSSKSLFSIFFRTFFRKFWQLLRWKSPPYASMLSLFSPCICQNYARKSAHTIYEHKF